jgi:hypothetical protein
MAQGDAVHQFALPPLESFVNWSRESHSLWPVEFRAVVRQLVRGLYSMGSVLSMLPIDVLELVIQTAAVSG